MPYHVPISLLMEYSVRFTFRFVIKHSSRDSISPTAYRKLSVDRRGWAVLYYLYQLFREGGCNAVKQWGLLE
jgi:hypothetical protein